MNSANVQFVHLAKTIGQNVRRRREALGMTQDDLANVASISRTALNRLELGKLQAPRLDTLEAIASALKISLSALLQSGRGRIMFAPLVEDFLVSDLAKKLHLTAEEIRWLQSFPEIEWLGGQPNIFTVYELIRTLRAAKHDFSVQ